MTAVSFSLKSKSPKKIVNLFFPCLLSFFLRLLHFLPLPSFLFTSVRPKRIKFWTLPFPSLPVPPSSPASPPSLPSPPHRSSAASIILPVVLGVLACLAIFLAIGILFWKYFQEKFNLKILPPEVRWFYEEYYRAPGKWKKEGMKEKEGNGEKGKGKGREGRDGREGDKEGRGGKRGLAKFGKLGKDHLPFLRPRGPFFYHQMLMRDSEEWDWMSQLEGGRKRKGGKKEEGKGRGRERKRERKRL
jgi:type IV secretory pathway TraG/TraD family ATPase VirD4